MMSPGLLASEAPPAGTSPTALIVMTIVGALASIILKAMDSRKKPTGLSPAETTGQTAAAVVERIASGVAFGPSEVATMAAFYNEQFKSQETRISRLERHETAYIARIGVLEWFAKTSPEPPPRNLPPWPDDPRLLSR